MYKYVCIQATIAQLIRFLIYPVIKLVGNLIQFFVTFTKWNEKKAKKHAGIPVLSQVPDARKLIPKVTVDRRIHPKDAHIDFIHIFSNWNLWELVFFWG